MIFLAVADRHKGGWAGGDGGGVWRGENIYLGELGLMLADRPLPRRGRCHLFTPALLRCH
jgi:hypothetical protein